MENDAAEAFKLGSTIITSRFQKAPWLQGADWPGSQENRDEDVAAVFQARMVRLAWGW